MRGCTQLRWVAGVILLLSWMPGCGEDDWEPPALPPPVSVYLVKPDSTGDFPTIQAALDSAADGEIIELADGTYAGDGNRDLDCGGKNLIVRSENRDPQVCIIDCAGSEADPHRGFVFGAGEGRETVLEGVTITNGFHDNGGGIRCWGASPTLLNVVLSNNSATRGGGLYCAFSSPRVLGVTFYQNSATLGGGVACVTRSAPEFQNTTFCANSSPDGACLFCRETSSPTLHLSILAYGADGEAVYCDDRYGVCQPVLTCCDVYGNAFGNWEGCIADQLGEEGNINENPLFCDRQDGDLRLQDGSPCAGDGACGPMGAWLSGCE